MKIRVGQGVAGRALEERKTIAVPDVRLDSRVHAFPYSGEQRFRSLVAVPLLVRGEPVGVLTARTARVRVFPKEQHELLEMIAAQVGSIVLSARLLDRALREASSGRHGAAPHAFAPLKPGAVLRGIGTSPGVARGPVHLLAARLDLANLDYRPARTTEAEWRALGRALRETVRQLNDLREAVSEPGRRARRRLHHAHHDPRGPGRESAPARRAATARALVERYGVCLDPGRGRGSRAARRGGSRRRAAARGRLRHVRLHNQRKA
jgi:phosphotransferase system enzyme I (PtsP)